MVTFKVLIFITFGGKVVALFVMLATLASSHAIISGGGVVCALTLDSSMEEVVPKKHNTNVVCQRLYLWEGLYINSDACSLYKWLEMHQK